LREQRTSHITGDRFYDGHATTHGFHVGMIACAGLAATGGVVAWLTISDEALVSAPERVRGTGALTSPPGGRA
jgi:hypothetical protein